MKKYRGYYIDHVYFNSEKDIDEFIKRKLIEKYKQLSRMFFDDSSIELSCMMSDLATVLINQCGMESEEVEKLEIEEMIIYSGVNA